MISIWMLSQVVCSKTSMTNVFQRDICVVPTIFPFRSEHAPNRIRWYRKAVQGLDDDYKSWYIASSSAAKPFAIVPDCTLWSMCECAYRCTTSHPIRKHTWASLLILTYNLYIYIYVKEALWKKNIYMFVLQLEWFQGWIPGRLLLVHRLNPWIVWNCFFPLSTRQKSVYIYKCAIYLLCPNAKKTDAGSSKGLL